MKKNYDVIIIGDGIAGYALASALQKLKKRVLIIGKKKVRGSATSRAGGILDPFLELSLTHPLLPICVESFHRYPALIRALEKETRCQVGYRKFGMVFFAYNAEQARELKKRAQWQRKTGIPVRWPSPKDLIRKNPMIKPKFYSALEYPSVARVWPEALLRAYKHLAVKRKINTRIFSGSHKLLLKGKRIDGIQVGKEKFRAPKVVIAAGSWSGRKRVLGLSIPVQPIRGQIAIARAGNIKINQILHTLDGGYIVPWSSSSLLLGSTVENVGFNSKTTAAGINQIYRKTAQIIPALKDTISIKTWAGLRPCCKDFLPLIGKTSIQGLYLNTAFYRSGILIGPYVGTLLAKAIATDKMPQLLRPFDPRRFKTL